MERQQFKVIVDAPREKVWSTLWEDNTYRQWTSVFAEGSRAETDWKKGSKVLFLDGNDKGMVSEIADNIPSEFMSIKHLGVMMGDEAVDAEKSREWEGAIENYTLKPVGNKTELVVEVDTTAEYKDHMAKIWPQALDKLKSLAERN